MRFILFTLELWFNVLTITVALVGQSETSVFCGYFGNEWCQIFKAKTLLLHSKLKCANYTTAIMTLLLLCYKKITQRNYRGATCSLENFFFKSFQQLQKKKKIIHSHKTIRRVKKWRSCDLWWSSLFWFLWACFRELLLFVFLSRRFFRNSGSCFWWSLRVKVWWVIGTCTPLRLWVCPKRWLRRRVV